MTCYIGPFGAFLYVLGCREPLPGLHEQYIAIRWRQVLGSTMHCVAGDGVGILAGAVIGAWIQLPRPAELIVEYTLGFAFGWTIFQAFFMRDMVGGSYSRSLRSAFLPELLSMNFLTAGMIPVMTFAMKATPNSHNPLGPAFWFVMSMSLLTGFIVAYPMNWWLVANHLKHVMMTVGKHDHPDQSKSTQVHQMGHHSGIMAGSGHATDTTAHLEIHEPADHSSQQVSAGRKTAMTLFSFVVFAIALAIGLLNGG